jgi:type III pantothenate kinase
MLLAVDAGNSSVSFAVFQGRRVAARFHLPHAVQPLTSSAIRQELSNAGVSAAAITAVALASVGPRLPQLQAVLGEIADVATLGVAPDFGMPLAYPNPAELGVDRWLNALAAYAQHESAVVVVDIGTATNFECVSATGEFLGGAICIGPQLSLDALSSRSAKLAQLTLDAPSNVLANNTREALLSGAYFGHAAMIDGMVTQLKAELARRTTLPSPVTVIGTGGFIARFAPLCRSLDVINPDLTLQGVQLVYERTRGQ